jgi:hypothetical protein
VPLFVCALGDQMVNGLIATFVDAIPELTASRS